MSIPRFSKDQHRRTIKFRMTKLFDKRRAHSPVHGDQRARTSLCRYVRVKDVFLQKRSKGFQHAACWLTETSALMVQSPCSRPGDVVVLKDAGAWSISPLRVVHESKMRGR